MDKFHIVTKGVIAWVTAMVLVAVELFFAAAWLALNGMPIEHAAITVTAIGFPFYLGQVIFFGLLLGVSRNGKRNKDGENLHGVADRQKTN